jgi:hypothetical protein
VEDFSSLSFTYGWGYCNIETLLVAGYTAYFRDYNVTWEGGVITDTINDPLPSDKAKGLKLGSNEKLSWFHQYNAFAVDPQVGAGILTTTLKIYVPVGSVLKMDDLGVIRDVTPTTKSVSGATVKAVPNKTYAGKAIKPTLTVKVGGVTLKSGTDYTLSYANNTKPGKATITITGKGNYNGTKSVTFIIVPKKAALSSVKSPAAKQLKATWKKDTGATGYEVQYALDKKFKKSKKTVRITKNKTVTTTIKKLKSDKTYYVHVRSYKTIGGKKYYGDWSGVKQVKVK